MLWHYYRLKAACPGGGGDTATCQAMPQQLLQILPNGNVRLCGTHQQCPVRAARRRAATACRRWRTCSSPRAAASPPPPSIPPPAFAQLAALAQPAATEPPPIAAALAAASQPTAALAAACAAAGPPRPRRRRPARRPRRRRRGRTSPPPPSRIAAALIQLGIDSGSRGGGRPRPLPDLEIEGDTVVAGDVIKWVRQVGPARTRAPTSAAPTGRTAAPRCRRASRPPRPTTASLRATASSSSSSCAASSTPRPLARRASPTGTHYMCFADKDAAGAVGPAAQLQPVPVLRPRGHPHRAGRPRRRPARPLLAAAALAAAALAATDAAAAESAAASPPPSPPPPSPPPPSRRRPRRRRAPCETYVHAVL